MEAIVPERTEGESPYPEGDAPERVAPDVWRIPLPLPFALRMVNIYLIEHASGARTLIDTGLGQRADEAALRAGLAHAGTAPADLTQIILTHAHPDHIGLSGLLQRESGANALMLAGEDTRMYQVWNAEDMSLYDEIEASYLTHGLPAEMATGTRSANRALRHMIHLPDRATLRTVSDGAQLTLGDHTYQVYWTPGHADGHMCLLRDDGLFFAGDHVLPHITPNIGYYPHARPNPLQDYMDSLERVRNLPATLVLPGHGRPFVGLRERADALRIHHVERAARMLALLADAPDGLHAGAVAGALFGARLRTPDDWRFAIAETIAHLEYARALQQLTRSEAAGTITYRLNAAAAIPAARSQLP